MEEEKTLEASVAGHMTEEETEDMDESEISELRRARERSSDLDQEILALSSRIRSFDLSFLPVCPDQSSLGPSPVERTFLEASEEAGSTFTSEADDFSDPKTEDLALDLELELLHRPQEDTGPEEAQQQIAELQQKLKESQEQIQLCEAQILESKRLEGEVEELREKEAEARHQIREEQQKRKAVDRELEDLQQEMSLQKEKEAQLERMCAEFEARAQQHEARFRVLEEEKEALSNELFCCRTEQTSLLEQMVASQQEKEELLKQALRLRKRMEASARKRQERRERRKARLRRAKEFFLSELKRREACIRTLENKLRLTRGQAEKMSSVNGALLQERKSLLLQLHDRREEATELNHTQQRLCAVQSRWGPEADPQGRVSVAPEESLTLACLPASLPPRVDLLGEAQQKQHEHSLRLATQVGELQRALRRISPDNNLQELQSQMLPFSSIRTFRSLAAL
ncbi:trichohyalin-like isoform X2 [Anolis carolinensis]|uniref:trichohyalin-like isoform X2 n=1 Tax=Anolis carolinensis TaxID=28377 RepID=UPI002F2B5465